MKRYEKVIDIIQSVLIILLIIIVILLIRSVEDIQGNAKFINYVGKARGLAQRIIKLEISNVQSDKKISEMDSIFKSLQEGGGEYNLKEIDNNEILNNLSIQESLWRQIKIEIFNVRQNKASYQRLLDLSEEYYTISDNTVHYAQDLCGYHFN